MTVDGALVAPLLFLSVVVGSLWNSKRHAMERTVTVEGEEEVVAVDELVIFPIKSCKGISVQEALVTKRGFHLDRIFMVVDASTKKFLTQRTFPLMALIEQTISEDQTTLLVQYQDKQMTIPLETKGLDESNKLLTVSVWGEECESWDMGEEAAAFFKGILDRDVRLVRMRESFVRQTSPEFAPLGQTSFSDGFPFLLLSRESVQELNKRSTNGKEYFAENFRPNIIVRGCRSAFREDVWKDILFTANKSGNDSTKLNGIVMQVVKPCSRCKVPSIDHRTGVMDSNNSVTKLLQTFRTGSHLGFTEQKFLHESASVVATKESEDSSSSWRKEVFVGQNLDHQRQEGFVVRVNDSLCVLSYRSVQ